MVKVNMEACILDIIHSPEVLESRHLAKAGEWLEGSPTVEARLTRRKQRSTSRLAGVRRAADRSGGVRELADIGAPTFEM